MTFTTLDIEGAQAGTWRRKKPRKPGGGSSLDVSDIRGASPTRLIPHQPNRSLDFTLTCTDIIGASPAKRNQRKVDVDPNVRDYGIREPEYAKDPPQRPMREIPCCADITTYIKSALHPRDTCALDIADIEGTSTRPPPPQRTTDDKVVKNYKRHTDNPRVPHNPLSPRYVYDVPDYVKSQGKAAMLKWATNGAGNCNGDPGFRPMRLPKEREDRPMFSLSLAEIDMSNPRDPWIPLNFPKKRRASVRRTNDVTDIPGTAASCAHKKYSAFVRVNHDRNPHYQKLQLPPSRMSTPVAADAALPAAAAVPRPSSAAASRKGSAGSNPAAVRAARPTSAPPTRSMAAIRADEVRLEDISSVRALP